MADARLRIWESLLERALALIDSVSDAGIVLEDWSFGGGTVLMRRHHHRVSKDIDIFLSDPQYLGYLSPRLNPTAESMTAHYVEQAGHVKIIFPEGEIDFVVSAPLTENPYEPEIHFGRPVNVESSTEIVAKKVWHRGVEFTARDMFDLALVVEKEPDTLYEIQPVLRDRRDVILERIRRNDIPMREEFLALEILDYQKTFDECVALVTDCLRQA